MTLKTPVMASVLLASALCIALYGRPSSGHEGSGNAKNRSSATTSHGLTSGAYKVCDVGNHDAHGTSSGQHLDFGDPVVIGSIDLATDVQLGRQVLSMILLDASEELRGTYDFAHQQVGASDTANVTHLVRIRRDYGYRPSAMSECTGEGSILIIQFCAKVTDDVGSSNWDCDPANAHFGDVHAQE